jgi:UDP-N-acetyl-D-galactosamine dehydrogenase
LNNGNTKIVDIISVLKEYGISVTVFDPWADPDEVKYEYTLKTSKTLPAQKFDAVVLGVAHAIFLNLEIEGVRKDNSVLYDVKGILEYDVDAKL